MRVAAWCFSWGPGVCNLMWGGFKLPAPPLVPRNRRRRDKHYAVWSKYKVLPSFIVEDHEFDTTRPSCWFTALGPTTHVRPSRRQPVKQMGSFPSQLPLRLACREIDASLSPRVGCSAPPGAHNLPRWLSHLGREPTRIPLKYQIPRNPHPPLRDPFDNSSPVDSSRTGAPHPSHLPAACR